MIEWLRVDGNLVQHYLPHRRCLTCEKDYEQTPKRKAYKRTYNATTKDKYAETRRAHDNERRQDPERKAYMRGYMKEYRRAYKRKPLTLEQRARRNEWTREHRRKHVRSDRPRKPSGGEALPLKALLSNNEISRPLPAPDFAHSATNGQPRAGAFVYWVMCDDGDIALIEESAR